MFCIVKRFLFIVIALTLFLLSESAMAALYTYTDSWTISATRTYAGGIDAATLWDITLMGLAIVTGFFITAVRGLVLTILMQRLHLLME